MGPTSFAFRFVYLLHILFVIVGFGSSFVWPALASRARKLASPQERYALTHTAFTLGKGLTTGPIVGAGIAGVLLVILSKPENGEMYKFSQTWISIAFLLFFIAMGISIGLHAPNLKKMDELAGRLASGEVQGGPGGPPPEVAELQERGKKAAMYGGILHLLFAALLIDMIWKPGF